MPITRLDPHTALIVVDLQKGITALPLAGMNAVVANAARLASTFRALGQPVVLVNVAGRAPGRTEAGGQGGDMAADALEIVPELDQQPTDIMVTKRTWGAFTNTDLDARLRERGVTQVVICGISTSIGVESTARQAHELGYHVALATDAMLDRTPEAHENTIARIFPRLGETGSTDDILVKLRAGE